MTVLCNSFVLVFFEIVGGVWVVGCFVGMCMAQALFHCVVPYDRRNAASLQKTVFDQATDNRQNGNRQLVQYGFAGTVVGNLLSRWYFVANVGEGTLCAFRQAKPTI